jgi:ubiquinone biosynthesis UbiH/UbiF/VisC/COQ6 family hydroxylase
MAAALALSRQGLQVALLGSLAESTQADLRAFALNAASVRLLQSLKVWDALPGDARTPVHDMHVQGDAPGASLDFSAWQQSVAELAWIVDAAELERALRAAVRFAPHIQMLSTEPPGPLQTPLQTPLQAPLQILAEGKDSATRERLGVVMPKHAYGQHAIAARLHTTQAHAGLARQWFRCPDVLALLPIDRPTVGHGLALVWSLPDAQADALMALPDEAFTAALMDATAGEAGSLQLTSARAQWPLAVAHAQALFGPGWVLVGDAAHQVHPLAGQGLNLGLADVVALAQVLAGRESWRSLADPKLLARYARQRQAPVRVMAQVTDGLLQLFASPQPLVKELRNRGLSLVNQLPPIKRLLTRNALDG